MHRLFVACLRAQFDFFLLLFSFYLHPLFYAYFSLVLRKTRSVCERAKITIRFHVNTARRPRDDHMDRA